MELFTCNKMMEVAVSYNRTNMIIEKTGNAGGNRIVFLWLAADEEMHDSIARTGESLSQAVRFTM